ncbi:MAG: hypothetical protein O3A65_02220 [Proteobacteria bacterium]|nr:hypothetical protein [Pseudomonadota bacterium]
MLMNLRRLMLILGIYVSGIVPTSAAKIQKRLIALQGVREWSVSSDENMKNKFSGFVLCIHDAFNELFFCTQSGMTRFDLENTARAWSNAYSQLRQLLNVDVIRQSLSEAYKSGER